MRRVSFASGTPPIRLFHWLVVALVAAAYVTWRLNWMVWHGRVGDAVARLAAISAAMGLLWQRDGAIFPVSHLPAEGRSTPEKRAPARARPPDRAQSGRRLDGAVPARAASRRNADRTLRRQRYRRRWTVDRIVPAAVANAIEAAHAILWNVLLAAIVLHVLAIAGYAAIKGQNLLCADDHRDKGPAGKRGRAAHRGVRRGQPSSLPAAPRLRPSSPSSVVRSVLGGIT